MYEIESIYKILMEGFDSVVKSVNIYITENIKTRN